MMITDIDDVLMLERKECSPTEQKSAKTRRDPLETFGLNLGCLTTLRQAVMNASEMDLHLIENIKKEIASGKYQISSENIAMGMLQFS